MYLETHPRRPRGLRLPLAAAALLAALAVAPPGRGAGFEIGTLLPPALREAQVGSVAVGLDGRIELRDVRWSGSLRGVRVAAAAPLVRLALGGNGATVPVLELTVDLAPGEAAAAEPAGAPAALPPGEAPAAVPPRPAAGGDGAGPGPADARRGPLERAVAAADRAVRLLGPVVVDRAAVTVRRGDTLVGRLEPLTLRLEPRPDGALRGVVTGELAPAADAPSPAAAFVREGRVTLELDVTLPADGPLSAEGRALVEGLVLAHPAIAPDPIAFRRLSAGFRASIARGGRRVHVETRDGRLNEAAIDLTLDLTRRPRGAWRVAARAALPDQPCEALIDAVPDALLGTLAGSRWRGAAGFALTLTLDTDDPRKLRLALDGDPDRCEPQTLGRGVDRALARLSTPFRTTVGDPSGATPFDLEVGPGTPGFVPYDEIPRHVRVAALATEDRRFFHHKGVSLRLIQGALRLDLAKRQYYYGGSTITQQLVKNLLLTRDKSLARKFQELLLAREVERHLTKERILELYLNCIEYGPGVYGLGPAARYYFGKDARRLDVLEGAFLMALKPSPRTGYLVFKRYTLPERWRAKLRVVLQRMVELGAIDEAAVDAHAPYQPGFVRYDPALHRPYPRR